MIDPEMPDQQLRLSMGELTANEVLVARAAIRWANRESGKLPLGTLEGVLHENDVLRGLLAKGKGDCQYCSLPADQIGKCERGFPGCSRMDDIVNYPAKEAEEKLQEIQFILDARTQDVTFQHKASDLLKGDDAHTEDIEAEAYNRGFNAAQPEGDDKS